MGDIKRERGSAGLCGSDPLCYLIQDDDRLPVGFVVGRGLDWEAYVGRESADAASVGRTRDFEKAVAEIFRVHDLRGLVLEAEVRGVMGRAIP